MQKIKLFLISMMVVLLNIFTFSEDLKTIEALPKREAAPFDIEITKIKTTPIVGELDETGKRIIFDFKDMKRDADNKNYEIFVVDTLENLPTYVTHRGGNRAKDLMKMGALLRSGGRIAGQRLNYGLIEKDGQKVLEVIYQNKPKAIYIGVIDLKTGTVPKVYKGEVQEAVSYSLRASKKDFSYTPGSFSRIIIDPSHEGDYISDSIAINMGQNASENAEIFPVIALGNQSVWKRENQNIGLPFESALEDIQVSFSNSGITGKITPILKYRNSSPSNNVGNDKRVYHHTVAGQSDFRTALGAYEKHTDTGSGREYIEATIQFKIDGATINQIKSYVSKTSANSEGLVEIKQENGGIFSFIIGDYLGNGMVNIPSKNISDSVIQVDFPKIYMRKERDQFEDYFEYDVSNLHDYIIDEKTYFSEQGNIQNISGRQLKISLGSITLTQKKGNTDIDRMPAIGIGTEDEWKFEKNTFLGILDTVTSDDSNIKGIELSLRNGDGEIYPYLIFTKLTSKSKTIYKKFGNNSNVEIFDRYVMGAAYNAVDSIKGELKIALPKTIFEHIKTYAYEKNEEIVEIPYNISPVISLIPSAKSRNNSWIKIPYKDQGKVREISYPKIKFKKRTVQSDTVGNFGYDSTLKDKEIGEESLLSLDTSGDINILGGNISFYQTNFSNNDNWAPMIALGKNEKSKDGFRVDTNTASIDRNPYSVAYSSFSFPAYFIDIKGEKIEGSNPLFSGEQKTSDNKYVGAWNYSENGQERISSSLKLEIPQTLKALILEHVRDINTKEVILESSNKISLVQGKYESNKYQFPYGNSQIKELDFPKIRIVKDYLENKNLEIEFLSGYAKGTEINFDMNGQANLSGVVSVNTNGGVFMEGLPENKGGTLEVYSDGKSVAKDKFTDDKTISLSLTTEAYDMDIKYDVLGKPSIKINEWRKNSETLQIVHREKSGLIRRGYVVTINSPAPSFELISTQDLDFGTLFKTDLDRTAEATVVLKNLTASKLELTAQNLQSSDGKEKVWLPLLKNNSVVYAYIYPVGEEIKDSSGNSSFIIKGHLDPRPATEEGEHRGTLMLEVKIK